jgi:predicted transposase/invertase (TIGR01784 family)
VDPELLAVPEIREAIDLSEEAAYTKEELAIYDTYWDTVSSEKTLMADKYAEGKIEGKVEGANEKSIEIAQKMLDKGYSTEAIAEVTGFSVMDLKSMLKS